MKQPIYTLSHTRGHPSPYSMYWPRLLLLLRAGFFYWRMITLNDVKWGEKRSTRIMTFWREETGAGQEGGWGGVMSMAILPPCLSLLLTNWVTSSAHPLFREDRTLLASMDLIIIPMSILNMWHKFHSRSLSMKGCGEQLKMWKRN